MQQSALPSGTCCLARPGVPPAISGLGQVIRLWGALKKAADSLMQTETRLVFVVRVDWVSGCHHIGCVPNIPTTPRPRVVYS